MGVGEEQLTHVTGVAHVQEHRGGFFFGGSGSSGRRWEERRDNPVRGSSFRSSEVTATVDVIEADGYIILFY